MAVPQVSNASTAARTVVSIVEPSSWNWAGIAGTGGAAVATEGLIEAAATLGAPAVLTIVVAGLPPATTGLATGLAATAAPAATATAGAAPATAFATGKFPGARTAATGRLGLTVIRAVSLGGAVLTMEVPVLPLGWGIDAGTEATGFIGMLGGGGTTTVVAGVDEAGGVPPGTTGLTGLNGATGLSGPAGTGRTAPGPGLAPGRTGAGGIAGFTGETPTGAGLTGGGGPALGVPDMGVEVGDSMMGCVLRGGATPASVEDGEGGGIGVGTGEAGAFVEGRRAVVVGETRGGGTTVLDFFLAAVRSSAVSATAAAAIAAGTTVAGRGGKLGAGSSFLVGGD